MQSQTMNDYLSVSVDRSQSPPLLRVNGKHLRWSMVRHQTKELRKAIRQRLADMPEGNKLVAYTMKGAVLPLSPS